MDDTRELMETINTLPITNQPLLDTPLKDMLASLYNCLHTDMMTCIQNFKDEVGELGGRIDHIEQRMKKFTSSYKSLVDAYNEQDEVVASLKARR